uniref:G protein-coupled receptor n=1 Tax=Ditylenchus dipsaci TaxID=166011 RepID=A0A915CQX1_9BILA
MDSPKLERMGRSERVGVTSGIIHSVIINQSHAALISSSAFTGAALYVSLVESPARLNISNAKGMLEQFKSMYTRGAPIQAGHTMFCSTVGVIIAFKSGDYRCELANMQQTRILMCRWEKLHMVRTLLGLVAAVFTKQGNVLMLQMGPFKKSSPMTVSIAISPNETKLAELTSLVSSDDYTLSYFTKGTSPLLSYINFFFIATFLFTFTGIIWYRELNIQITRALIAQMFVPCILTLAPLSFYVFASEQKFNLKHSSFFMNLPINWSPVINPLSTILIIKQYRRSLLNFKKIVKKSHVTAVEARLGPH